MKTTRDVTKNECFWLDKDVPAGTEVYPYNGATYGCISPAGEAVTLDPENGPPFFELPKNALPPRMCIGGAKPGVAQKDAPAVMTEQEERRRAGTTCEDEGCPHYGTPHAHVDTPAGAAQGKKLADMMKDAERSNHRSPVKKLLDDAPPDPLTDMEALQLLNFLLVLKRPVRIQVEYTNWRGVTAVRRIEVKRVRYGHSAYHPSPCLLLCGYDLDKGADRDYAMADMNMATLQPLGGWNKDGDV